MLQKGDYVLTKRSIEKAPKQGSRGVACVHSCIDIGAEEALVTSHAKRSVSEAK